MRHIGSVRASDEPTSFLHPRAASIVSRQGKVGTLSRQFYDLMAEVGLVGKRLHRKKENPGNDRRAVSGISFHALRHTATSLLKNAGISSAIVEEFVGHDSEGINRMYTHIDHDALRGAVDALPVVL
jgi:integrase